LHGAYPSGGELAALDCDFDGVSEDAHAISWSDGDRLDRTARRAFHYRVDVALRRSAELAFLGSGAEYSRTQQVPGTLLAVDAETERLGLGVDEHVATALRLRSGAHVGVDHARTLLLGSEPVVGDDERDLRRHGSRSCKCSGVQPGRLRCTATSF
jgi:hypothetical protein